MKIAMVLLSSILSVNAFAADVVLFANINVTNSSTLVSTNSSNGIPSVDSFSSEETYVIGSVSENGNVSQIVTRVEGCKWLVSPKTLKLLVSNTSNAYAGMFQKTTYKMEVNSENDCKSLQRAMRSATTVNPVKLQLTGNQFTIVK